MKKIIAGIISFMLSYGMVYYLVMPTLQNYPRLDSMAQRFEYTDEALWLFIFLSLWLFYWQWEQRLTTPLLFLYFDQQLVYGSQ